MKVSISPIYACLITIIITLITLFSVEIPNPIHSTALAQYPPPPITEPSPYPEPPILPTNTPIPPTNTPIPPTDTPIPPTDTAVPPTDTPIPPTATPTLFPTTTPTPTSTPLICNPEQDLSGKVTSKGLFEVTNTSLFCDYRVGVATYRLLDDDQDIEEKNSIRYYDATTAMIKRAAQTNRPATLQLEVGYPSCVTFTQHGFWGNIIESLDQEVYGERELAQQQFASNRCDSSDETEAEQEQQPRRERTTNPTQNSAPLQPEQNIERSSSLNVDADEAISAEDEPLDEAIQEFTPAQLQPHNTADMPPNTLPLTGETDEQHGKGWLLCLSLGLVISGIMFRRWKIGYNAR